MTANTRSGGSSDSALQLRGIVPPWGDRVGYLTDRSRCVSAHWCENDPPKRRSLSHQIIPTQYVRQVRMVDVERIPTMNCRCGRNIAHGKGIAGEKGTVREPGIEYPQSGQRKTFAF